MSKTLGILGGGQLGLMMMEAAERLGIDLLFLDPNPECSSAVAGGRVIEGDFKDYQTVIDFAQKVDRLTVEIEHVNVEALEYLETQGIKVFPSSKVLRTIQDKGLQKQFYADHGLPSSNFCLIEDVSEIDQFPMVQKVRTGGYDGKGVQVLKSKSDLEKAFTTPSVLEDMVDIDKEIGVIVVRNEQGEVRVFPPVDMEFSPELNLVKYVKMRSGLALSIEAKCESIAKLLTEKLKMVGVLAVEFFVTKSGEVLINEAAPRVHNSGHLTIEGLTCSQFEVHIRAVMGLDLPEIKMVSPSVMVNLLGEDGYTGTSKLVDSNGILEREGIYLHWYEKNRTKPGRKMGHVTICAESVEVAKKLGDEVLENVKVIAE